MHLCGGFSYRKIGDRDPEDKIMDIQLHDR
jgi:hypothetical protein